MKKCVSVTISALIAVTTTTSMAFAADPIYEGEQYANRSPYRQKTTYVAVRGEVCDELLIEYRHPYDPHAEIVRVCHAPIF